MSAAAQARALAAEIVTAVHEGQGLDAALEARLATLPATLLRERALIQELVYGAIRGHYAFDGVLRPLLQKPIKAKEQVVDALLRIGLHQLLYMDIGAHAAVKETVEATVVLRKDWAKGLMNALLRRVAAQAGELRAGLDAAPERAWPKWLAERVRTAWPEAWPAIAAASNARPPMTLRLHAGRAQRAAYLEQLAAAELPGAAVADCDDAITLARPVPVERLPGFDAGLVSVQDAAAQLAAPLLDAHGGMRVLDACAAPGGKAAHLLEREPRLLLTALDVDPRRLGRVEDNFRRLGLNGRVCAGDALKPPAWWDGTPFDRILLDAPCSATGVIRRHPDIRLHRRPEDLGRLGATQARMLDALWPLLAPGGKLLYVTCSILPEENRDQIAAFGVRTRDARPVPLVHAALAVHGHRDAGGTQLLPEPGGADGFYYALLEKAR